MTVLLILLIKNIDIECSHFQGDTLGCSCSDCEATCSTFEPPDYGDEDGDFVIVEGVDGVVFIMVIIFVIGTIIFLAIVAASTALKRNISQCKKDFFLSKGFFKALKTLKPSAVNKTVKFGTTNRE